MDIVHTVREEREPPRQHSQQDDGDGDGDEDEEAEERVRGVRWAGRGRGAVPHQATTTSLIFSSSVAMAATPRRRAGRVAGARRSPAAAVRLPNTRTALATAILLWDPDQQPGAPVKGGQGFKWLRLWGSIS